MPASWPKRLIARGAVDRPTSPAGRPTGRGFAPHTDSRQTSFRTSSTPTDTGRARPPVVRRPLGRPVHCRRAHTTPEARVTGRPRRSGGRRVVAPCPTQLSLDGSFRMSSDDFAISDSSGRAGPACRPETARPAGHTSRRDVQDGPHKRAVRFVTGEPCVGHGTKRPASTVVGTTREPVPARSRRATRRQRRG